MISTPLARWNVKPSLAEFGNGPNTSDAINQSQITVIACGASGSQFDTGLHSLSPYSLGEFVNSPTWANTLAGLAVKTVAASAQYLRVRSNFHERQLLCTASVTVAVRMQFQALSTRQDFCGMWDTIGGRRSFLLSTAGGNTTPQLFIATNGVGGVSGSGNSSLALSVGTWYTIVGVWNQTSGDLTLYIDGIARATTNLAGTSMHPADAGGAFTIGAEADATFPTDATYAGARLWNRALSSVEIARLSRNFWAGFERYRPLPFFGPPASNQTITGVTVPTHAAIGSPTVYFPLTLTPGAVGPRRNFGNPTVAGPLGGAGLTVPTHRSIGSPSVTVGQTITVSSLSGPRTIGAPVVAFVTVVRPAALNGPRSIGSPTIAGGPQFINVYGVPANRSFPIPTIRGGDLACRIYIGGVDVTSLYSWSNGTTVSSQTIGRWKATLSLEAPLGVGGYLPQLGQTVLIVDFGYRLFAGCITERVLDRYMMTSSQMVVTLTATDKSGICDHRIIPGYTYAAGSDVASVVLDIIKNCLNGEGIVPDTAIVPGAFGVLTSDLKLNFVPVTNGFDQIALLAGLVWWIDEFGRLFFSNFTDLPAAPFSIAETSLNWRAASGSAGMRVAQSTTDLLNKLYAVSNLNVLPGSGTGGTGGAGAGVTESYTWVPDGPGIMTITDSLGARVAVGIIASVPIGSISSLTVNGVAQTTLDFGLYAGQTASPPDLLWIWGGPATGAPGQQVQPQVLAGAAAAIVITYTPYVSTSSSTAQYGTAIDPLNPEGDPLGTCGSGILEGVVQVQNLSTQSDLDAFALATLRRVGGVPTTIAFETDTPGLKPGQKLLVNVPLSGANNLQTLITSVSGVFVPPTLAAGGSFRWQVSCRTDLDPGNWQKWYERLLARTANPLPVLQYEFGEFVLGAGSNLSAGVDLANPYIVKRTGKAVEILAAASVPPVNQDLLLQVQATGSNGTRVIGTITIPTGTLANAVIAYEIPDSLNLYVFSRETLNVTATYSITGTGTPVKASRVSLTVRWAM